MGKSPSPLPSAQVLSPRSQRCPPAKPPRMRGSRTGTVTDGRRARAAHRSGPPPSYRAGAQERDESNTGKDGFRGSEHAGWCGWQTRGGEGTGLYRGAHDDRRRRQRTRPASTMSASKGWETSTRYMDVATLPTAITEQEKQHAGTEDLGMAAASAARGRCLSGRRGARIATCMQAKATRMTATAPISLPAHEPRGGDGPRSGSRFPFAELAAERRRADAQGQYRRGRMCRAETGSVSWSSKLHGPSRHAGGERRERPRPARRQDHPPRTHLARGRRVHTALMPVAPTPAGATTTKVSSRSSAHLHVGYGRAGFKGGQPLLQLKFVGRGLRPSRARDSLHHFEGCQEGFNRRSPHSGGGGSAPSGSRGSRRGRAAVLEDAHALDDSSMPAGCMGDYKAVVPRLAGAR